MIIAKQIDENGGMYNKFSKKVFYVFQGNFDFKGRKPIPEDFIKKVKIKSIGVFAPTGREHLCRIDDGTGYKYNIGSDKIYISFEECLQDNKEYIDSFLLKMKREFFARIVNGKQTIKNIKKDIKKYENQIELIDNLIIG